MEQKQSDTNQQNQTMQKKLNKRKFKVPYAKKKNEDTKIPSEKVTLSSAEMENTMEQKNTLLEKSGVVSNEESYLFILLLLLYLSIYLIDRVQSRNIGTIYLRALADFYKIELKKNSSFTFYLNFSNIIKHLPKYY